MQKEVPSTRTRSLSVDTTNGAASSRATSKKAAPANCTLRCVGPKASGSVSFVRALSHTCVPSSSVTVVTASPVFS